MQKNMSAIILIDYLTLQTCLIFTVVFLVIYRLFKTDNQTILPPGPTCLPIIGNIHKLGGTQMHVVTAKLSEQFGGIMTVNLAGRKAVLLTDLETIREAFVEKGDYFSNRYQPPLTDIIHGYKGKRFKSVFSRRINAFIL